jgi:hypothetical protein
MAQESFFGCIRMREKKILAVCIIAFVFLFAIGQNLSDAPQQEDSPSVTAPDDVNASWDQQFDTNPCGGGGGDDGGGNVPR